MLLVMVSAPGRHTNLHGHKYGSVRLAHPICQESIRIWFPAGTITTFQTCVELQPPKK